MFILDKRLESDSFIIADLALCQVLLMNNVNYPWLILVPKIVDAVELTDLSFEQQTTILSEINLVAKILQKKFSPYKLNIGALGNIVRQLHIHVIARFKDDKAFPNPVWGAEAKKYDEESARRLISEIKKAVDEESLFEDSLAKQLLYRSIHRGCKETDFLIGEFAKEKITTFNKDQLLLFADFIVEDDMLIYDWILAKSEIPKKYLGIISDIRSFHKMTDFVEGDKKL